jgi:hypothetical protein
MARWLHTLFGLILGLAVLPSLAVDGIEGRLAAFAPGA